MYLGKRESWKRGLPITTFTDGDNDPTKEITGARHVVLVSDKFAQSLEEAALEIGVEVTIRNEGMPSEIGRYRNFQKVPKGDAEVVLFDETVRDLSNGRINDVYARARELFSAEK